MQPFVFVLSIFGAITGVIWSWEKIKCVRRWHARRRIARRSTKTDYYYKLLEVSCRWMVVGRSYTGRRCATIVSLQNDLKSVELGVGPSDLATFTLDTSPPTITLRQLPKAVPGRRCVYYAVDFEKPLNKGDEFAFDALVTANANSGSTLPSQVTWMSEHRVDRLVLRVVFQQARFPDHVVFRIIDQNGDRLIDEPLNVDLVSREAKKVVDFIEPNRVYMITW